MLVFDFGHTAIKRAVVHYRSASNSVLHLLSNKTLRPVVDATFPLERTGEAHEYLEGRHAFGKVVINVAGGA